MNQNFNIGKIWDKKWEKLDMNNFGEQAFEFDPWTRHHKPIIDKYAGKTKGDGIFLEAGCGMGQWCFYVSKKYGLKSIGADIAEKTIAGLQKNCHSNDLIKFVVDDLNDSKLEGNSFDMLISLGVIEHFRDSNPMMKSLYRVLKPGGIGIITVPNLYSFHTLTRPVLQFLNRWDIGYEKSFSPWKLKKLALEHNFNILEYGALPSGEMFGLFLNNLAVLGKIFRKVSWFVENRQNALGFISYVVVKKP